MLMLDDGALIHKDQHDHVYISFYMENINFNCGISKGMCKMFLVFLCTHLTFLSDPPALSADLLHLYCLHPRMILNLSLFFSFPPFYFCGHSPSHFQTSLLLGYTWGPFRES